MRILLVDDEAACRALLALCLRPHGTVEQAGDGPEGIAAIAVALSEKRPYQLILLDISMPGIDGQAALRTIRLMEEKHGLAVGQGAKIIMTTSHGEKEHILAAFRESADGYLLKPIDPAKLTALLGSLDLLS
jgi:two-component system chemotaxis response regulator CheY